MAKANFGNGTIRVDTDKVRNTVSTVNTINNNLERDFDAVVKAVNKLDMAWDGKASSKTISRFNSMKSNFCGASGRKAVMQNYLKFLSDAVAIGYETTEGTNTKLSELFK